MKLTGEAKFFVGIMAATLVILVGAVVFFSRPAKEVPMEVLGAQDAWATGSAQAKVTLVEFADFECPACGAAYPFVKEVVTSNQERLRYVFRHFPLDQHKNARLAAQAAEAAGAQGKFWEMHDLIFKNQTSLSLETINGLGIELGLDMDKFTKELNDGTYVGKIEKDIADGKTVGVDATPTFFLNGKKLSLFNFAELKIQVEKALQESQQ